MATMYLLRIKPENRDEYISVGMWEDLGDVCNVIMQILSPSASKMIDSVRIDVVEVED
ncbi:MAG: hypothetical protein QXI11_02050 [Thermoproteota archaeon]